MPAVREIFSVYLNGGVKSRFNKAERVENVKSVMLINSPLCNLNFQFSRKFSFRVTWPGTAIEMTDRSFNPILDWQEVSSRKSMGEDLSQLPKKVILGEEMYYPYFSTVKSHGDVLVGVGSGYGHVDKIKIVIKTGESKVVKLPDPKEGTVVGEGIIGLAVDNNNNFYVVRRFGTRTENVAVTSYMLYVLDENYNVKHVCKFDFFDKIRTVHIWLKIIINTNNNIIVIRHDDPHVYICDNTGKLKHRFQPPSLSTICLSISNKNEIMLSSSDRLAVYFYSEEGNLKSTIKLPKDHKVYGIAFHYVICRIIVLTYVAKEGSYFLLCYSETGELETSEFFCNRSNHEMHPSIICHPSGPVAVVRPKSITFI